MNLKFACYLVLSLCFAPAFGQQKEFLNEDGTKTTEDRAAYYRVVWKDRHGQLFGFIKEYYLNGRIRKQENYKAGNLEGRVTAYYPTGEVKSEANYEGGNKLGPWQEWYPNGQVKEEGTCDSRPYSDA
ncbi:MAG: hypothetical protein H7Z75_19185 [Ferruginibacter sp.]|nr:hypothetical protein [Cytophagales bacterium]